MISKIAMIKLLQVLGADVDVVSNKGYYLIDELYAELGYGYTRWRVSAGQIELHRNLNLGDLFAAGNTPLSDQPWLKLKSRTLIKLKKLSGLHPWSINVYEQDRFSGIRTQPTQVVLSMRIPVGMHSQVDLALRISPNSVESSTVRSIWSMRW
jgi:hypothetical protein